MRRQLIQNLLRSSIMTQIPGGENFNLCSGDDGRQGVGDSGGNNGGGGGGNNGDSGGSGGGDNNGGQGFKAEEFWSGPPSGNDGGSENGSSGTGGNQGAGTQGGEGNQGGGGFGDTLTQRLSSLNFGNQVLTPEVLSGLNEGNFDAFHTNLNSTLQSVVRESLGMNVQILKEYGTRLRDQILSEVNGNIEGRDDHAQLIKDFPSAADPRVLPMVQQVYAQALKNTGGDRTKAVTQTKSMLSIIASSTGSDIGLDVAPAGQGDSRPQRAPVKDWLEELSGRSSQ
jgi:hypothetical protein